MLGNHKSPDSKGEKSFDSVDTPVSKILLNYKADYKILTQIFGEVRRRQQTFNQETIWTNKSSQ